MSLYTYVGNPNSNLMCCICRTPFTDPVTATTCTHTFCRDCILRALSHAPLCPVDRSPLSEADLGPADPIIRSLVEELEVECVHHDSGCTHTCERQLLPVHLRDGCVCGQVECEESGCGLVVVRAELEKHRREKHGARVEAEAKKEDKEEGGLKKEDEDEDGKEVEDNQQKKTIELLTEQNMLLRYRVELLEGAMQVMKKEMGAVRSALGPYFRVVHGSPAAGAGGAATAAGTGTGLQPRPRVWTNEDDREEQVVVVVSPMGDTAGRPHDRDNNTTTRTTPPSPGISISNSVAGPSTVSAAPISSSGPSRMTYLMQGQGQQQYPYQHQQHHRASASLSLPGDYVAHGGSEDARGVIVDPLAGYFPTLGEFGMFGVNNRPVQQQQQVMQFGPHAGFIQQQQPIGGGPAGGLQLQMNPQTMSRVAPLDLGTNLIGTLEGLRESVVGVAAGVDSLGRRSEIALANETLRLGEEVISLRAGVHGLRMQMHAMMVERNAQVNGREEGTGPGGNGGGGFMFMPPRMYSYGGPPNITKL